MNNAGETFFSEVRRIVQEELRRHAVSRAEFDSLEYQLLATQTRLSSEDRATLLALLPALHHLCGSAERTAAEILNLARDEMVPDDDALRRAVARFEGLHASKSLGKFLSKVAGRRVGPYFVRVVPYKRPDKDAASYSVVLARVSWSSKPEHPIDRT